MQPCNDNEHSGADNDNSQSIRKIWGMQVKRETTIWNVISMPMMPLLTICVNSFVLLVTPLILEDEDYFAIPKDELGRATAKTLIWSQLLPIMVTPFTTFVYELMGRRIPITYALICTNVLVFLMPKVAPSLALFCALRAIIGMNNTLMMANPLISDYVKRESRGRAVAINTMFLGLSQFVSSQFFVPISKMMTFDGSFAFIGSTMLCLSIPVMFMIREPSIRRKNKDQGQITNA